METIYTGNLGQKLFLYNSDNFIYLRTSSGMDISKPILLCSDYSGGLSSVIYKDSIYFLYQNLHKDLVLRNIMDSNIKFSLSADNSPEFTAPLLLSFADRLLILYFVKNPLDKTYHLKLIFPVEKTEPDFSFPSFSALPKVQYLYLNDSLIFTCLLPEKSRIYQINNHFELSGVQILTEDALESTRMDYEKKLTAFQEQLTIMSNKIHEKDKLIESIRTQYDSLMNTALQYKEEASKWYHKFCSGKKERN